MQGHLPGEVRLNSRLPRPALYPSSKHLLHAGPETLGSHTQERTEDGTPGAKHAQTLAASYVVYQSRFW